MSIGTALNIFLEEYPLAINQKFSGHSVAEFIRKDIPDYIQEQLGLGARYIIHGSAGQGNWAKVPWVAIYDRLITETAQDGYYIVYLVKEDYSGVYISLNQGVTTLREIYGSDAKQALRARAGDYLARIGEPRGFAAGSIDLAAQRSSSLGALYESGNIAAKYYSKENIPADEELNHDLRELIDCYFQLSSKELSRAVTTEEDDEKGLSQEDLTNLKEHKRIERNKKLAEKAKRHHGYKCHACGFDFEARYGEIGKGFIEAHHLTPFHQLKREIVTLDPKKDFSVLCSNCHRMIHKTELVSQVLEFRAAYVVNSR